MMTAEDKAGKKIEISEEERQAFLAQGEELEKTRRDLEESKKQAEEAADRLLRAYADLENAKKRLAREKEDFVRFANEKLMRELLPILDNFDRALVHTEPGLEDSAASLKEGILLMRRQFADFLSRHGVKRVEAVGKKFDPHLHEALGHVESSEYPDETVLEEIEAGYQLEGRLLRPAKVRISQEKQ
jgi:molecular chaperone GrpE